MIHLHQGTEHQAKLNKPSPNHHINQVFLCDMLINLQLSLTLRDFVRRKNLRFFVPIKGTVEVHHAGNLYYVTES